MMEQEDLRERGRVKQSERLKKATYCETEGLTKARGRKIDRKRERGEEQEVHLQRFVLAQRICEGKGTL